MVTHLSIDDVVALNALIVTAIGLSFALGKKSRKPSLDLSGRRRTAYDEIPADQRVNSLGNNMDRSANHNSRAASNVSHISEGKPRANPSLNGKTSASSRVGSANDYGAAALRKLDHEEQHYQPSETRQLNVFFNWNGHTWDAYEVLGLPAGAGRESVVQAFHACRAKSPDSTAFLQAATDAILKRK